MSVSLAIKFGGPHLMPPKETMESKRLSQEETLELINRIPVLQHLFRHRRDNSRNDESPADGVMYLSRFHKDTTDTDIVKTKKTTVEDSASISGVSESVDSEQNDRTVTLSVQNRQEKRRLAMSLATLAAKKEKRSLIVKDGAIHTLISLAQLNDKFIQRSFSTAMSLLSTETSLRAQMIDEGACGALALLSQHCQAPEIINDCMKALCNLSCEPGYEAKVVKDQVTFAIVHAIGCVPDIVNICLKILLNLSCVTDKYSRIEDVTDSLMHINAYGLTIEQEILVASAMVNLSALKNFQLRLVEDGCIRHVEKCLKSPYSELRLLASKIVDNLATEAKTRIKLVDNGIVQVIMVMSKDEVEAVRLCAVKAIFNLVREDSCRERVVNANAIAVIIKISVEKFQNLAIGRTAGRILRFICKDEKIARKLVKDGIIRALMALLKTEDAIIQQNCAESICSLFQTEEVMGKLVEQGAVGILVALAQNAAESITSEWCSFALFHLATSKVCPASILGAAILPCIIKLSDVNNEHTKYFCAATLQHITNIAEVDSSSAIYILVQMLRNEKENVHTKACCASALYNLSASAENCAVMLESGVLLPVVQLTSSAHTGTKSKCAAILSRLSLHSNYYSHFATGNVLRVLLDLSCVDNLVTQRKVIIALSNLSQSKVLREQLLELKPIPFIKTLASKCDENVRRGCASIVCNLSFEIGSEKSLQEAGIVSSLLITAMITSEQLQTKVICVKALINLLADELLHKEMVADGIIWGFGSLFYQPDSEIKLLCMKGICLLSSLNFIKELLESSICMQAVTDAVSQRNDMELLRIGARALSNILRQTKDSDEKFRRKVVASIAPMVECTDIEISEISILCLCLASQSESCREGIVQSGMLRMIDASGIFFKPRVSNAYLTMFENIANNPKMRTKVLDDKCISRFMQICSLNDQNLDVAVSRAIYCLSCASDNIRILVRQNVLTLIDRILDNAYELDRDVTELLVAFLYNVSTCAESQGKLVSTGIVRSIVKLWDIAKEDLTQCTLCISALTHLAMGNVNTATMVNEGCTDILTFIIRVKKLSGYSNYFFELDVHDRVAIAFRNLMSVPSNHDKMVSCGIMEILVSMATQSLSVIQSANEHNAHLSREKRDGTHFHARRRPSFLMETHPNQLGIGLGKPIYVGPEHASIANNCAAALRFLSYNDAFRQQLIDCENALNVIMEGQAEDLHITGSLLRELEKESWSNGSRGTHKEGKITGRKMGNIYTELLGGTRKLKLKDVEIRMVELEKFHVRVEVEEPTGELKEQAEAEVLSAKDLASFPESDAEYDNPKLMSCPKQSCVVEHNDLTFLRSIPDPSDYDDDEVGSDSSSTAIPSHSASSSTAVNTKAAASNNASKYGDSEVASNASSPEKDKEKEKKKDKRGIEFANLPPISSNMSTSSTLSAQDSIGLQSSSSSLPTRFPKIGQDLPPPAPFSPINGKSRRSNNDLDSLPSMLTDASSMKSSSRSKKSARSSEPDMEFKKLLQSIKLSKKSGGSSIKEVIEQWHNQSRY